MRDTREVPSTHGYSIDVTGDYLLLVKDALIFRELLQPPISKHGQAS